MTRTRERDAAKDRLVEAVGAAREATVTAVRDEIVPAVMAAVESAQEASGPMYAEAASRAGDAVDALRGSDVVKDVMKTVRSSEAAKTLGRRRQSKRRWPLLILAVASGVAAFSVVKRKSAPNGWGALAEPGPMSTMTSAGPCVESTEPVDAWPDTQ